MGPFHVEDAWTVERLRDTPVREWPLVSVRRALGGLPAFAMEPGALAHLRCGRQGALRMLPGGHPGQTAVLVSGAGEEVEAVIEATAGGGWRLVRMLRGAALQGG